MGTSVIARQLAKQGSEVMASDIAADQVQMASALAKSGGLFIDFQIAAAEETRAHRYSLDAVTANQCFLYFNTENVVAHLQRWLKRVDVLVISHFFGYRVQMPLPRPVKILFCSATPIGKELATQD